MDDLLRQLLSGGSAGVIAGFALVLITGARGDWVFRRWAEALRMAAEAECAQERERRIEAEKDRDHYRTLLFDAWGVTKRVAEALPAKSGG